MNNGFPPPVLIETWIFVATSKQFDFSRVQMKVRRALKYYFGCIDNAQLYVASTKTEEIEVHFI